MTDHKTAAPPAAPRHVGDPRPAAGRRLRVLLVTGLSGAGHSTALNLLEDLGYEAVDNLPLALLGGLTGGVGEALARPIAIGVDTRTRDFSPEGLIEHVPTEGQPFPAAYVNGYNVVAFCRDEHVERVESLERLRAGRGRGVLPMTPPPEPNVLG